MPAATATAAATAVAAVVDGVWLTGAVGLLWLVWAVARPQWRRPASALWVHVNNAAPALVEQLLRPRCPSLFGGESAGFRPTWWLFNGHLQTAYAALISDRGYPNVAYERESLATPDGGVNTLDWCLPPSGHTFAPDAPTLILLHGLTGGSQEEYVKSLISVLLHGPKPHVPAPADVVVPSIFVVLGGTTLAWVAAFLHLRPVYWAFLVLSTVILLVVLQLSARVSSELSPSEQSPALSSSSLDAGLANLRQQAGKAARADRPVRCVVFNARGCAESELRTPQMYCAAYTADIRAAVNHVHAKFPAAPLFAVGFSLGSNILVKYLGEEGARTPLLGAASVGNPFDLLYTMRALHHRWFYRTVYATRLGSNLKRAFSRHRHVFEQSKSNSTIDIEFLMQSKTVKDFDERLTRRVFGYRTVDDVGIPLLCLNALDDPVSIADSIPFDECRVNPLVLLAVTAYGGHLGWHTGHTNPRRWDSTVLAEYFWALMAAHQKGQLASVVAELRKVVVPAPLHAVVPTLAPVRVEVGAGAASDTVLTHQSVSLVNELELVSNTTTKDAPPSGAHAAEGASPSAKNVANESADANPPGGACDMEPLEYARMDANGVVTDPRKPISARFAQQSATGSPVASDNKPSAVPEETLDSASISAQTKEAEAHESVVAGHGTSEPTTEGVPAAQASLAPMRSASKAETLADSPPPPTQASPVLSLQLLASPARVDDWPLPPSRELLESDLLVSGEVDAGQVAAAAVPLAQDVEVLLKEDDASVSSAPIASESSIPAVDVVAKSAEPTVVAQEPTVVAQEPAVVAQEPTVVAQEPTVVAQEPTSTVEPGEAPEELAAVPSVFRLGPASTEADEGWTDDASSLTSELSELPGDADVVAGSSDDSRSGGDPPAVPEPEWGHPTSLSASASVGLQDTGAKPVTELGTSSAMQESTPLAALSRPLSVDVANAAGTRTRAEAAASMPSTASPVPSVPPPTRAALPYLQKSEAERTGWASTVAVAGALAAAGGTMWWLWGGGRRRAMR